MRRVAGRRGIFRTRSSLPGKDRRTRTKFHFLLSSRDPDSETPQQHVPVNREKRRKGGGGGGGGGVAFVRGHRFEARTVNPR